MENNYTKKSEIIYFYNAINGSVDWLDKLYSIMSYSRKTRMWPMCIFYGI